MITGSPLVVLLLLAMIEDSLTLGRSRKSHGSELRESATGFDSSIERINGRHAVVFQASASRFADVTWAGYVMAVL